MRFSIEFYGGYINPEDRWPRRKHIKTVEVSAKKMPAKWMEKTYGKYWREHYKAMYYCTEFSRKRHGVIWVWEENGRFDSHMECVVVAPNNATDPAPMIYSEVRIHEVHNRTY